MYKNILFIIVFLLTFSTISFADAINDDSKEVIIDEILDFSRSTYEKAPRQEGKIETGLNYYGPVYTIYPEITKEIRDKLIDDTLIKIETMLNSFSKEELILGFEEYKIKLVEQARFSWYPKYQEPEYVELAYYESSLRDAFKFAIQRNEAKIKEEMERVALEEYSQIRVDGMPSVWAKKSIDDAIERGYVPQHLQDNYQNPITREEFAEIFVTTVFADFSESVNQYKPNSSNEWDESKSIIDNFLNKVKSTEYFTDTENKYIKAANILGIVNGSGNNEFKPSDLITREQAAVMVVNYYQSIFMKNSFIAKEVFSDYNEFSSWAQKSISIAYEHEIVKGTKEMKHDGSNIIEKGYFDVKGKLTREQAILIISKAAEANYAKNKIYLRGLVATKIEELVYGYQIDGNVVVMNEVDYASEKDEENNSNEEVANNFENDQTDTNDDLPYYMKMPYYDADRTSISADEIENFKTKVIEIVNAERATMDLAPLVYNKDLDVIAQMRAQDMADRDYYSHISPDSKGFLDLIMENDLNLYKSFKNSGENILKGSIHSTPDGAMLSWMNSSGHKANILYLTYKTMAVGYAYDADTGTSYWVQLFTD